MRANTLIEHNHKKALVQLRIGIDPQFEGDGYDGIIFKEKGTEHYATEHCVLATCSA